MARGHGTEGTDKPSEAKEEELIELITHVVFYSCWPSAMSANIIAKELFSKGTLRLI